MTSSPAVRQVVAPGEREHPHRRFRRVRADDLEAETVDPFQGLAPLHQRREYQIAQRTVLEEERSERISLDGDVPQRLRHDRSDENRLTGEKAHLAEKAGREMAHDLDACRIDDRDLTLDDRHERVGAIAHAIENVADLSSAFLTQLAEPRQLGRRECRTCRHGHDPTRAAACRRKLLSLPCSPLAIRHAHS